MYTKAEIMSNFLHIINQDGVKKTDGEVLDELIEFATDYLSVLEDYSAGVTKYYKDGVYAGRRELYRRNSWDNQDDFPYGSEPTVMGFELEVDRMKTDLYGLDREKLATQILARTEETNDIICKRDGSLRNGFEIVSHPATYDYYYNKFDWSWTKDVIKSDFITEGIGELGFHIHINKASFIDEAHTQRFAQAIVDDVEKFHSLEVDEFFIPETSYCQTFWSDETRYCAVSLVKMNTVEVRCLAPVPTRDKILTYLRYVLDTQTKTRGEQQ